MSDYKEGEGIWYITPDVFETTVLESNKRYTVIVMGDGEVLVRGYATVDASEFDEDFRIHLNQLSNLASLTMKLPVFSSHYIYNFDVIIRDDEKTLHMMPNVNFVR